MRMKQCIRAHWFFFSLISEPQRLKRFKWTENKSATLQIQDWDERWQRVTKYIYSSKNLSYLHFGYFNVICFSYLKNEDITYGTHEIKYDAKLPMASLQLSKTGRKKTKTLTTSWMTIHCCADPFNSDGTSWHVMKNHLFMSILFARFFFFL